MAIRQNKTVKPTKKEEETPQPETTEPVEDTTEVAVKEPAGEVAVATEEMPTLISLRDHMEGILLGFMAKDSRIVGANGGLTLNKKVKLGEYADIQVVSTSFRWMIGPDVEGGGDAKSNKMFRASYDNKVIPGFDGEDDIPIDDWIAEIEAAGYPEVKKTKYLDVFCTIFNTEKSGLDLKIDEVFQIQVSTTAIRTYDAFTMQTPLKVARGSMLPSHQNCMRVVAEGITGDRSYTILKFDTVPLDIVKTYTPVLI